MRKTTKIITNPPNTYKTQALKSKSNQINKYILKNLVNPKLLWWTQKKDMKLIAKER